MIAGLMLVIGILLGFFGLVQLTQATLGVGLICLGCLAGIVARVAQAAAHEASRKEGK